MSDRALKPQIDRLRQDWDALAVDDAMWAVLTDANKKDGQWEADDFFANGEQEMRWLFCELDRLGIEVNQNSALDFGCGVGRITQALASRFQHVIGLDISQEMIRQANRFNRFPERCHYKLNEADHLDALVETRFDLIYSTITLQHMPWSLAKSYLRAFADRLRPEGLLAFQLPSGRAVPLPAWKRMTPKPIKSVWHRVAKKEIAAKMQMHTTPKHQVIAMLENLGLALVDTIPNRAAGVDYESFFYIAQPKKDT
jgi:trans-aconitate methyltransferase